MPSADFNSEKDMTLASCWQANPLHSCMYMIRMPISLSHDWKHNWFPSQGFLVTRARGLPLQKDCFTESVKKEPAEAVQAADCDAFWTPTCGGISVGSGTKTDPYQHVGTCWIDCWTLSASHLAWEQLGNLPEEVKDVDGKKITGAFFHFTHYLQVLPQIKSHNWAYFQHVFRKLCQVLHLLFFISWRA